MGNSDSIDLSLSTIYKSWHNFRKGKRASHDIIAFQYSLEDNLWQLFYDLRNKTYKHGGYNHFTVQDTKKREIAVASVRDRVVHRLLYDYLVPIWDKTLIYDVWSCRTGKGLHEGIARAQQLMLKHKDAWVWRSDIHKMFDSINHVVLKEILSRRINNPRAIWLLDNIIDSYHHVLVSDLPTLNSRAGIPIGNLTSQIFGNIYLNELDRLTVHTLKPLDYMRYGDDWLCFGPNEQVVPKMRTIATEFLSSDLKLAVSPKLDFIQPTYKGLTYLGVDIWPTGLRLTKPTKDRMFRLISEENYPSYDSLVKKFSNDKNIKRFIWETMDG